MYIYYNMYFIFYIIYYILYYIYHICIFSRYNIYHYVDIDVYNPCIHICIIYMYMCITSISQEKCSLNGLSQMGDPRQR